MTIRGPMCILITPKVWSYNNVDRRSHRDTTHLGDAWTTSNSLQQRENAPGCDALMLCGNYRHVVFLVTPGRYFAH